MKMKKFILNGEEAQVMWLPLDPPMVDVTLTQYDPRLSNHESD